VKTQNGRFFLINKVKYGVINGHQIPAVSTLEGVCFGAALSCIRFLLVSKVIGGQESLHG